MIGEGFDGQSSLFEQLSLRRLIGRLTLFDLAPKSIPQTLADSFSIFYQEETFVFHVYYFG